MAALVYLSEVARGGETEFPSAAGGDDGNEKGAEAPLRVTPQPGALIFHNCYPGETGALAPPRGPGRRPEMGFNL